MNICEAFYRRLIVSCQARDGEPFRDSASMAKFALSAVTGGAAAIRARGADDIRAIRRAVDVPILGISKVVQDDGRILITATFEDARELVEAGAGMIALDVTCRGQRYGALERVRRIGRELKVPVMADIATVEEALAAAGAGADFVLTTMRGYTDETAGVQDFDLAFVEELVQRSPVPVIAEGKIDTPEQVRAALEAGAYAVVVGSAITRPVTIAQRFADAAASARRGENAGPQH
jgi:putative N-acetylmannosamine-6-phosphate epimerase